MMGEAQMQLGMHRYACMLQARENSPVLCYAAGPNSRRPRATANCLVLGSVSMRGYIVHSVSGSSSWRPQTISASAWLLLSCQ